MSRGRSQLKIGDYGDIHVQTTASGSYRAEARYRDWDGVVRKVAATGASRAAAKTALRRKLNDRAENAGLGASLNQESPLRDLADEWLADVPSFAVGSLLADLQLGRGHRDGGRLRARPASDTSDEGA